jgi:hypothetical protein
LDDPQLIVGARPAMATHHPGANVQTIVFFITDATTTAYVQKSLRER